MKQLTLTLLLIACSFTTSGDPATALAGCTECKPVCSPQRVQKEEKKHCWKVLRKYVCIPGFKLPWQSCCTPRCGKVRCISVLEKHEYQCKKCGYEWEVKMVCTGGKKQRCCDRQADCCPGCGANGG